MLYPECNTETALAEALGYHRMIIHRSGKSKVLKTLSRVRGSKGLVDEDPGAPKPPSIAAYMTNKNYENLGLQRLVNSKTGNSLIVLCPRLEEWILIAAKESKIDMGGFNLPDSADELHGEAVLKLERFRQLVSELQKRQNKRIIQLGKLLRQD